MEKWEPRKSWKVDKDRSEQTLLSCLRKKWNGRFWVLGVGDSPFFIRFCKYLFLTLF